jgi:DNA-binding transcriptional LysR family regulator
MKWQGNAIAAMIQIHVFYIFHSNLEYLEAYSVRQADPVNIDTNELRTFITLVQSGSFSWTAERLSLTQPAVSKRIALLEDKLGTILLERFSRHIRLTEAGELFLARAINILKDLDSAITEVSNSTGHMQGILRIACSHHIGLHHLPAAIRQFTGRYPEVQFECRFIGSEEANQLVNSGQVELALVTLPETRKEAVSQTVLWNDPLHFVAGNDHALTRQPQLTLAELTRFPALLPDETTETFKKVAQLFDNEGLSLHPAIPTNYLETLKMMVSVGLGWSVLPQTMLDGTLTVIRPAATTLARTLGALTDSRRILSKRAEHFLALLQQLDYH